MHLDKILSIFLFVTAFEYLFASEGQIPTSSEYAFRNCSDADGDSFFGYRADKDQRDKAAVELSIDGEVVFKTENGTTIVNNADYTFKSETEILVQQRQENYGGKNVNIRTTAIQLIVKYRYSGKTIFDEFVLCKDHF